jgi:hypothetical protein
MYEHRLQEAAVHNTSVSSSYDEERVVGKSVKLLQHLKSTEQLQEVILGFVEGDDLPLEYKVELRSFFRNALGTEPHSRNETLWKSFKLLEQ